MAGIDLNTFVFDYDLTFVMLLMNADGTIYHTYGGRDWRDPQSHLSQASFRAALEAGRKTHAAYKPSKKRVSKPAPLTVEMLPAMKRRLARGDKPTCYHCHTVNDMRTEEAMAQGTWTLDQAWRWPDPIQIGITLEKDRPTVIASVEPGSLAADGHLKPGDRIVQVHHERVATFGDIQRALRTIPNDKRSVSIIVYHRDSKGPEERGVNLFVDIDWQRPTPRVFAWRASKWPLSPKPGFGGRQLDEQALKAAGLPPDSFAFKVGYLVTWGPNAHTGRNAAKAGIRKGDIVYEVAGKSDFESVEHFHAWFRLTQKAGTTIEIKRIGPLARSVVRLPVVD